MTPRVAALTIYPVKSAAGITVDSLPIDAEGAVGDRRWLVVDERDVAITARDCHAMLRIRPQVADGARDGHLTLFADGMTPIGVAVPSADASKRAVRIWDDVVEARDAGDAVAAWCEAVLGRACRLVRLGAESKRPLRTKYTGGVPPEGRTVAFTDGAPLLVLGLSAIDALNARLVEQGSVETMDRRRFRANIWLDALSPHEEDTWRRVRIGEVTLGLGTWCPRCVLTTIDPDTRAQGVEPMRTLATYRRHDGSVVFGVNTTHVAPGVIRVGDAVSVIECR